MRYHSVKSTRVQGIVYRHKVDVGQCTLKSELYMCTIHSEHMSLCKVIVYELDNYQTSSLVRQYTEELMQESVQ